MDGIPKIGRMTGLEETAISGKSGTRADRSDFAGTLHDAIEAVDDLQKESEAAQQAFARREDVDLHDVLIKIEEAEIAFKTMMEIRNKLVDAYRDVMRMGS